MKGSQEVEAFHFRSGFMVRRQAHEDIRLAIATVLYKEIVESRYHERKKWHRLLIDIFWPGPTACTMAKFKKETVTYIDLAKFHQIRVVAAMGKYSVDMLWFEETDFCLLFVNISSC